jgi:hypothetical protein
MHANRLKKVEKAGNKIPKLVIYVMKYFRVVSWLRHLITRVKSQTIPGICGGQNVIRFSSKDFNFPS